MALNPRKLRFRDEYLKDLNQTQAAIRAGYNEAYANRTASRLMKDPELLASIQEAMDKRSARTEITQDMVLKELAKIGFSNMQDYIRVTEFGDPFIDLSEMTEEQAAVLSEATVDDYTEGRGEDARNVRKVKIKLHDKLSALEKIGRHLGMFPNKVELSGRNGKPIETVNLDMTPEEAAEAYADTMHGDG